MKAGRVPFLSQMGPIPSTGISTWARKADSYGDFDLSVTPPPNPDTPTPPEVGLLDVHGFASVGYLGDRQVSPVRRDGQDQGHRSRGQPEWEVSLLYNLIQGPITKLQPTAIYWFYGRAGRNRLLLSG